MLNRHGRLAGAIALGALALLAALPAWLGWRAELTYRALLDGLAATAAVSAPVHRYRRSWLHSEVESEVRAVDGTTLTVRLRLDHGPLADEGLAPVMAYVRGEVRLAAPTAAAIPPLTLEGATDLGGATRLTLTWPAARLESKTGVLAWDTLHASLRHERDTRRLLAQLETPWLQVSGERAWRADSLRLQLDLRAGKDSVPLGNIDASTARLALPDDETIDDARLTLVSRPDSDSVTLTADARLNTWRRHGLAAGPGRLTLAAQRLEPAALLSLLRLAPTLAHGMDGTAVLKLAPLVMQLARRAPAVELTTLRLGDGPTALTGRGRLAFDARGLGEEGSPGRMLTRLSGEFELALPTALANGWLWPRAGEAGARVAPPPPYDRLFTPEQDDYRLRAALKQDRLLVNGEPWHGPLPTP